MNNSIKLTIIKILKDTINKIENDECSLDDEEILSIAKNLIHIKLNNALKNVKKNLHVIIIMMMKMNMINIHLNVRIVEITMMKIMMITMMIISVHLDILFQEVDINKLYI